MALMINGEMVDDAAIREEAELLRPHYEVAIQGMDPVEKEKQLQDWARENVIEKVLLRQAAQNSLETISPEAIDRAFQETKEQSAREAEAPVPLDEELVRKQIETRLRTDQLVQKITSRISQPKFKQVAEYYRKNKNRFQNPELVRASHIVKNIDKNTGEQEALAAIRQVQDELGAGGSFEDLANRYSDCPGNGGDLGYFPKGQMVQEFEDAIFSLKVNETSQIFRTPFGYHIAKVYDRKPASSRSLPEVQDELTQELYSQKKQRALEAFLDRLKAKADIKEVDPSTAARGY